MGEGNDMRRVAMLISIPLFIFYRDVRKTLVRFDVLNKIPAISPTDTACFEATREVFASDPKTFIFIYGHPQRLPQEDRREGRDQHGHLAEKTRAGARAVPALACSLSPFLSPELLQRDALEDIPERTVVEA